MPEPQNIHGRKWGRGIRPWILLPKYFAVGLMIGGIFASGVLASVSADVELIARIFHYQIIPASALAVTLGILLLLQHPREFIRMRWLRVKLVMVVAFVPVMHFMLSLALKKIRDEHLPVAENLGGPLSSALAAFILIALIGRLKPRLGQPYS